MDCAKTSSDLINLGRLAKRVTILPLTNMDNRVMDSRKLAEARRIAGEKNVHLAKDLIEYSPELEPAMRHVFGNTLVSGIDIGFPSSSYVHAAYRSAGTWNKRRISPSTRTSSVEL